LLTDRDEIIDLNRGPAIDSSFGSAVLENKIIRNRPIKHGRHRQLLFLTDQFLNVFSSETVLPNEPNVGGKHPLDILLISS
jgi:hypothetical protein